MLVAPCKDCPTRHLSCHSTCEKYLTFKKKKAELNAKIDKAHHLESDIAAVMKVGKKK